MNREIKFRGKAKASTEELNQSAIKHDNGWICGVYLDGYVLSDVVEADNEYIVIGQWVKVEESTIGQYIGRTDEEDNLIFEGSVVSVIEQGHSMGFYYENEFIGVVEYDEDECTFYLKLISYQRGGETIPAEIDGIPISIWNEEEQELAPYYFSENIVQEDIRVLGNIYDNPEFLKELKE